MSDSQKAKVTDEIMTLDEVAAYLKVTTRTIYRMLEEDQIPAFKIRGAWRFRKDEIEKMTKQNNVEKIKTKKTGGR
jgi:excisionase family DNA binding protein